MQEPLLIGESLEQAIDPYGILTGTRLELDSNYLNATASTQKSLESVHKQLLEWLELLSLQELLHTQTQKLREEAYIPGSVCLSV